MKCDPIDRYDYWKHARGFCSCSAEDHEKERLEQELSDLRVKVAAGERAKRELEKKLNGEG